MIFGERIKRVAGCATFYFAPLIPAFLNFLSEERVRIALLLPYKRLFCKFCNCTEVKVCLAVIFTKGR